jgi:transcriptional regulator MraZ
MFRGTYEHSIDDKGRVSVPAKFREELQATKDERVVITNFVVLQARCLEVYPFAAWAQLEERLRTKPQFDQRVVNFLNYYVSAAHDCVLDKQGRILLPPPLRDYGGLKRDIVFTSALDKFRIWDREAWQKVRDEVERMAMDRPEEFNVLEI